MRSARQLLEFLRKRNGDLGPLLILTHNHPDPDAVASAFALAHLAKWVAGIPTRIAYAGIIGRVENQTMVRILKIPVHPLRARVDFQKYPSVALVDTQPDFGNNPFPKEAQAALVVDHHPVSHTDHALCSVIEPKVGATSVILAQALLKARYPIPVNLATALAYGIISETQDLGRETRDLEIQTYQRILPLCDIRSLALIQNPPRPPEFFQTVKRSLDNAFITGPLIGAHLGAVRTPDLVALTADFLLTYQGMRWSVCTGRYQGRLHVSLRAMRPGIHAGRLLQEILQEKEQAGGHGSMAGGSEQIADPRRESAWRKAQKQVVDRLLRRLFKGRSKKILFPFRA